MLNGVFYMHTKVPEDYKGFNLLDRATIACRVVEDRIQYGISVCTAGDNFCRRQGREKAMERMLAGYGEIPRNIGIYEHIQDDEGALSVLAAKLADAFVKTPRKYKRKLEIYNKKKVKGKC